MFSIRTATMDDLELMIKLVGGAAARIKKEGFDQWQKGYPDKATLMRDIEDKNAYIALVDGEPAGMMALSFTDVAGYDKIEGRWIDDNFYCGVHRLCVSDDFLGRGVATALMAAAQAIADEMGYASVRVDTHAKNAAMRGVLEKCGYTHCGRIKLVGSAEDGDSREAYQKIIK